MWCYNRNTNLTQEQRTQPPPLVQLSKRRSWNKRWFQLLYIIIFIWIIFSEFLKQGFHWQRSKRLYCPLCRNIRLTSYRCCAASLIVLQDKRGSNNTCSLMLNMSIKSCFYLIFRERNRNPINLPCTAVGKFCLLCVQLK